MKCVICKLGETEPGFTTVTLERGDLLLVTRQVPAQVCSNCGEAYVDEETAERLLDSAAEMAAAGEQVGIRRYVAA